MILSILIPSLFGRSVSRENLIADLTLQAIDNNVEKEIEILVDVDDGKMSVGQKRNRLMARAEGEYLCFIDDDDRIAADYIPLIFEALKSKPDCCSLNGVITFDGLKPKVFMHSIRFAGWYERAGILYRFPNHLNVVKSSIAKRMTFPHVNHAEDKSYSNQLRMSRLLKKEAKIEPTLYYYDYLTKKPA